jgi:hypothetical protein
MTVVDLPAIQQLYAGMLAEALRGPTLKYPQPTRQTPAEMIAYLYGELTRGAHETCPHCHGALGARQDLFVSMVAVLGGVKDAEGRVTGGRPVGFTFGEIAPRAIGTPKLVGHCRLIYVDPAHRAGRSIKRGRRVREGVGRRLLEYLVAEAVRLSPEPFALEGSFVPGSHGARLWPRLGLKPYVTYCAFVAPDGSPRDVRTLFGHRAPPRINAATG